VIELTDEEYQAEQQERAQLEAEIAALEAENAALEADISSAIYEVESLEGCIDESKKNVVPKVNSSHKEVSYNEEQVKTVLGAIEEMSSRYFVFKTLSSASKSLTQATDEYNTQFSNFHQLRRITLGYVIGLDTNIISSETLRKSVEKEYLQNTEYWLAYAIMAVMLWASNEREAADRAVSKALNMDYAKASLFFILINLRFERIPPARDWFREYMDRVDPLNLDETWIYLLQAYLSGTFGADEKFNMEIRDKFSDMITQARGATVDFNKSFINRAYEYESLFLHTTDLMLPNLRKYCTDYDLLMQLQSSAEKNAILAENYGKLYEAEDDAGEDLFERIETVLYSLISSYEEKEYITVKKMKYNEYIISAGGDITAAKKKFDNEYGEKSQKSFAQLLIDWSFSEDMKITPVCVKRFAVSCMKEWILKGFRNFTEEYRTKEQTKFQFNIDGCILTAAEQDEASGVDQIDRYYEKDRMHMFLSDRLMLIFLLITAAGVLFLGIMFARLPSYGVSPVPLTIGILLVLIGVFMVWRHGVELLQIMREKKRRSIQSFRDSLKELAQWRMVYHKEDARYSDLEDAVNRFENA
jgi:hypothetical protein